MSNGSHEMKMPAPFPGPNKLEPEALADNGSKVNNPRPIESASASGSGELGSASASGASGMDSSSRQTSPIVELTVMLESIEGDSRELGEFTQASAESMPVKFQQLLAHNEHMTVAVEGFHGGPVSVQVLQSRLEDSIYIREILLRRTTDQQVVQYGIVRLQLMALDEAPRIEILSEKIPLGRVLIEHNVLREVELVDLWKIVVGPKLARLLHIDIGSITYGRTAMIYFSAQPALELLEIVV